MADYVTKLGHAHLKVRNLERSQAFYQRFFKLDVIERIGNQYVFLSGSDVHHEIALQQVGDQAPSAPRYGVGLYHIAFEVPDRRSFALAYQALNEAHISVAAVDHLISWALYFDDPDGNGLEIYWDTRDTEVGQRTWQGQNMRLSDEKILAVLA